MSVEALDKDLTEVLAGFAVEGRLLASRPQPGGHIHRSLRIELEHDGVRSAYLAQRLNTHVFRDVGAVMGNLAAVSAHLVKQLAAEGVGDIPRRCLSLVPGRNSDNGLVTVNGIPWRMFPFIEGTVSRTTVESQEQAAAVGKAYGAFGRCLSNYAGPALALTIPHFHDTARRYAALQASAETDGHQRVDGCRDELAFAAEHRALADVLPPLIRAGRLPNRIAHNDAKPANVLFDTNTGEGLAVVDLDTVMPGSALHDFGDMVRSCTSSAAEDRTATSVDVDLSLFAGLAEGYLTEMGATLTPVERQHLALAGLIITYEQGLRFLSDHLDGDRYFASNHPGHNLERCRNQFALAAALERRMEELRRVVG